MQKTKVPSKESCLAVLKKLIVLYPPEKFPDSPLGKFVSRERVLEIINKLQNPNFKEGNPDFTICLEISAEIRTDTKKTFLYLDEKDIQKFLQQPEKENATALQLLFAYVLFGTYMSTFELKK